MNVHYSSSKQKDDAEGDSEIIRADTLTTVPRDRTSSFSSHLARIPQTRCHPRRHVGRTFQRAAGAELWGWHCHCYDPERWDTKPERIILKTLEPMRVAFLGFGLTWNLFPLLSFLFFPFWMGTFILDLPHHSILEAHNLCGFPGSELERNLVSGWIIPQVSCICDLDGI